MTGADSSAPVIDFCRRRRETTVRVHNRLMAGIFNTLGVEKTLTRMKGKCRSWQILIEQDKKSLFPNRDKIEAFLSQSTRILSPVIIVERHLILQECTLHPSGEWAPQYRGWILFLRMKTRRRGFARPSRPPNLPRAEIFCREKVF